MRCRSSIMVIICACHAQYGGSIPLCGSIRKILARIVMILAFFHYLYAFLLLFISFKYLRIKFLTFKTYQKCKNLSSNIVQIF